MSDSAKRPIEELAPDVFVALEENLDWIGSLAELSLAYADYRVRFVHPDFPFIDWTGINRLIGYHLDVAAQDVESIRQFLVEKKLTVREEK